MSAPYCGLDNMNHLHLDGSEGLIPIFYDLHRLSRKPFGLNPRQELKPQITQLFHNPHQGMVEIFKTTTDILQNPVTLFLATEQCVIFYARKGLKYIELTIAPQYLTRGDGIWSKGFSIKEAIDTMVEGIKSGEDKAQLEGSNIEANLLISVGREISSEEAVCLVNIAGACDHNYVVGIGLVCDEAHHPPEKHIPMFKRAKEWGFKTTCHAGEWATIPPNFEKDLPLLIKNIRTAVIDLGVDRIGHATALAYDKELVKMIADKNIGIEGCPVSNLVCKVIPDLKSLKIRELLEAGILYSLNPDDDIFMPDFNEVFQLCNDAYKFTPEEKQQMRLNVWKTRFGNRKPVPRDIAPLL
ncbi:MAG: hypothetical protein Q7S43_01300 [bacterium]|nr:hypothetical protein [bacterium]